MGELARKVDVEKLISYSDDLVEVLKNKKDLNTLMQSVDGAKMLRSSCDTDFCKVNNSLQEYEKKINAYKQRIDEAKTEVVTDTELDSLQKEFEEELQRERLLREELRVVSDEISDLEDERVSVEEQKKVLKKLEEEEIRARRKLSMYASVTNIIPNLDDQTRISGHIVERDRKIIEKFEFEPANASPLEICNSVWKMINM